MSGFLYKTLSENLLRFYGIFLLTLSLEGSDASELPRPVLEPRSHVFFSNSEHLTLTCSSRSKLGVVYWLENGKQFHKNETSNPNSGKYENLGSSAEDYVIRSSVIISANQIKENEVTYQCVLVTKLGHVMSNDALIRKVNLSSFSTSEAVGVLALNKAVISCGKFRTSGRTNSVTGNNINRDSISGRISSQSEIESDKNSQQYRDGAINSSADLESETGYFRNDDVGISLSDLRDRWTVSYYHNGSLLNSSDRCRVTEDGSLHISSAVWSDGGLYQCLVTPSSVLNQYVNYSNDSILLSNISLSIVSSSGRSLARVTQHLAPVTRVRAGVSVELECAGEGWPLPKLSWTRGEGLHLPPTRHKIILGNLILSEVTRTDEGLYTCTVENRKGSAQNTSTYLVVTEAPALNSSTTEETLVVDTGSTLTLECPVSGNPTPQVIWYHNAKPVNTDADQATPQMKENFPHRMRTVITKQTDAMKYNKYHIERSSLVIKDISDEEIGAYQCFARNYVGAINRLVQVKLKEMEILNVGISVVKNLEAEKPKTENLNADISDMEKPNEYAGKISIGDLTKNENEDVGTRIVEDGDDSAISVSDKPSRGRKSTGRSMPSRPIVSQDEDSDTTLRVDWTMESEMGGVNNESQFLLAVQMKASERDVAKNKWVTLVEGLSSGTRTYTLKNTDADTTYQFRIVAVYSDEERLTGRSSKRFSSNDMYDGLSESRSTTHLLAPPPFNNASISLVETEDEDDLFFTEVKDSPPPIISTHASNEQLFVILGCVLGLMLLVLMIVMATCAVKQRKRERLISAIEGRTKFHETSRTIHLSRMSGRMRPGSYNGHDSGRFLLCAVPALEAESSIKKSKLTDSSANRNSALIEQTDPSTNRKSVLMEQQTLLLQQHHFLPQLSRAEEKQESDEIWQQQDTKEEESQDLKQNLNPATQCSVDLAVLPANENNKNSPGDKLSLRKNLNLPVVRNVSDDSNNFGFESPKSGPCKYSPTKISSEEKIRNKDRSFHQLGDLRVEEKPRNSPGNFSGNSPSAMRLSPVGNFYKSGEDFVSYRPPVNPTRSAGGSAATTPILGTGGDGAPSYQKSSLRSARSNASCGRADKSSPGTTLSRALDLSPDHIPRLHECQQFYRSPDHSLRSRDRSAGSRTSMGRGGASGRSSEMSLDSSNSVKRAPGVESGDFSVPQGAKGEGSKMDAGVGKGGIGKGAEGEMGVPANIELGNRDYQGDIVDLGSRSPKASDSLKMAIANSQLPHLSSKSDKLNDLSPLYSPNENSRFKTDKITGISQSNSGFSEAGTSVEVGKSPVTKLEHSSGKLSSENPRILDVEETKSKRSSAGLRLDSLAEDLRFADDELFQS